MHRQSAVRETQNSGRPLIVRGRSGYSLGMPESHLEILGAALQRAESFQGRGKRAYGFYWTRKSAELASDLVSAFSKPGSVVLDPFLGSGTTGIGVVSTGENRLFIGVEVNELPLASLIATFRPETVLNASDIAAANEVLLELKQLYIFSVQGEEVEIEKIVHDQTDQGLEPQEFHIRRQGSQLEVLSKSQSPRTFEALLEVYQERLNNLSKRDSPELETNSRIAVKKGMKVADAFGPLGFEGMCRFKEAGGASTFFRLVLSGSVHLCRLTDSKSQSQFPFWRPQKGIHEKSSYQVMLKKTREVSDLLTPSLEIGPELLNRLSDWDKTKQASALLIQGSTMTDLKDIPSETVDLVLTDPPYFDQVAYSEYLKLWEFFTGFKSDLDREIVESSRVDSGKSRQQFLDDLGSAFSEVRRVARKNSLALVYFKDSKPKNLHDFITVLGKAGYEYLGQRHLSKASFTYKQNATVETTVGGDAIMLFRASDVKFEEPVNVRPVAELDDEFLSQFSSYVDKSGPSSLTEALDNSLIASLYKTGYLAQIKSSKHFVEVISKSFSFEAASRKWYRA